MDSHPFRNFLLTSYSGLANYRTFWLEESHTLSSHPSLPNYQTTKLSDVKSLSNHHHGMLYHASDLVSSTYPTLLNYHSGWRGPTPHLVTPPSLTIKLPSSLTSKAYQTIIMLCYISDLVSSTYPTLLNYHSGWRGPTPHQVTPPSLTIKLPSSLTSKDY